MLTKQDLKEISKIVNTSAGAIVKESEDRLRAEIRELRDVQVQMMAVMVTKDEFYGEINPMKKDIEDLKHDVNIIKDTQAGILNTLNNYIALNDSRVDRAHLRIDQLQAEHFKIKKQINFNY